MFAFISDSAAASDGGSLALFVERLDGKTECFVINRSLASRDTPDYNLVTSDLRSLSANECAEIARHLERLTSDVASVHPVGEFIKALKAQSSKMPHASLPDTPTSFDGEQ
jgi:hypothetical protein